MQPNPSSETFKPCLPNARVFIACSLNSAANRCRHLRSDLRVTSLFTDSGHVALILYTACSASDRVRVRAAGARPSSASPAATRLLLPYSRHLDQRSGRYDVGCRLTGSSLYWSPLKMKRYPPNAVRRSLLSLGRCRDLMVGRTGR